MASIADLATLDWGSPDFPDDFQILDAIVLVKGVYEDDDGDLTRSVWTHRWTMALSRNPSERIGQLRLAEQLTLREGMSDYQFGDDDGE